MSGANRRRIERVRERDGDLCCYCNGAMRFAKRNSGRAATLEHVVDWSIGGRNDMDNLRLAHKTCNNRLAELPVPLKVILLLAANGAMSC